MNTTVINTALNITTGKTVTEMAILSAGASTLQVAKNFSNNTLPVHFNEVKEEVSRELVKEGYTLLTETEVITYNGSFFQGINKVYSAVEVSRIIKNEETLLVK
jgi:hypothetical protein